MDAGERRLSERHTREGARRSRLYVFRASVWICAWGGSSPRLHPCRGPGPLGALRPSDPRSSRRKLPLAPRSTTRFCAASAPPRPCAPLPLPPSLPHHFAETGACMKHPWSPATPHALRLRPSRTLPQPTVTPSKLLPAPRVPNSAPRKQTMSHPWPQAPGCKPAVRGPPFWARLGHGVQTRHRTAILRGGRSKKRSGPFCRLSSGQLILREAFEGRTDDGSLGI